jgi:hypothetical protein
MWRMWLSTVCSEMSRRAPICLLLRHGVPAQPLAGDELGLKRRRSERGFRRLLDPLHERGEV